MLLQTLRMQGTSMSPLHLQRMTGVEFALDQTSSRGGREQGRGRGQGRGGEDNSSGGRLFLVKKQRRESPSSVHVLSVYYILDGTVYQSPNLLHLMMTKYNKITSCLSTALTLSTECVNYTHPRSQSSASNTNEYVNVSSTVGSRPVFPVPPVSAPARREGAGTESGKKRQKIIDCRDFPSFNNCVSDMISFVNIT